MEHWTNEQIKFLTENITTMTTGQIATALHKSDQAIRLYCYRNGIALRKQLEKPMVPELMRIKFGNPSYFRPNRDFFVKVKISQKRFSLLRQGYAQPTADELKALSREWNVSLPEAMQLITSRQLNLFE